MKVRFDAQTRSPYLKTSPYLRCQLQACCSVTLMEDSNITHSHGSSSCLLSASHQVVRLKGFPSSSESGGASSSERSVETQPPACVRECIFVWVLIKLILTQCDPLFGWRRQIEPSLSTGQSLTEATEGVWCGRAPPLGWSRFQHFTYSGSHESIVSVF